MARSEEVAAFAQRSRSLPWLEPIEAYSRLRSAGFRPALLDGLGAHPEARHAFLAASPARSLRLQGDRLHDSAGPVHGDLLDHLRAVFRETQVPIREEASFTGGWLGFWGYEAANLFDGAIPARATSGPVPDALLRLYLDAIVFDRKTGTVRAHAATLDGNARVAEERLGRLVEALSTPVQSPPVSRPAPAPLTWSTSLDEAGFTGAVLRLKALIHDGDLFQANLATRFQAPCSEDPAELFRRLQAANPSPFMALLEGDGFSIVSSSPEQLFAVEGGRIRSRPIAGTRKRGATPEEDEAMERDLLTDPKEQAEHTMLVDLVRNDVARVAVPGTVHVPERMSVERYRHVMHLVSRVEANVRPGTGLVEWMAALFPGGTITGAPKVRATERIHEAEPVPRGPYTGSAGFLSWSGQSHWNILIRTLVLSRDPSGRAVASVHAGSGIVADSDPAREWKEAHRKARALLEATTGPTPPTTGAGPGRLGEVTPHGAWRPPTATARFPGARVLLIDNFDSFVHNLADYASALGATTRVVRNDAEWRTEVASFQPTHVILSPGPGWPADAGCTKEVAQDMTGRLPVLGVCLGHQAIAEAHGARIIVKGPVHGKPDFVQHDGTGLFSGLPSPIAATRYHSLVVEETTIPPEWRVTARLADGTVMAICHRDHPTHGLQFHPESICTDRGLELVARFLGETT